MCINDQSTHLLLFFCTTLSYASLLFSSLPGVSSNVHVVWDWIHAVHHPHAREAVPQQVRRIARDDVDVVLILLHDDATSTNSCNAYSCASCTSLPHICAFYTSNLN
jgi:hypothetical protein